MSEITDLSLIEDVKNNNSSDSLNKLSERHSGLFLKIARRYTGGTKSIKFPLDEVLEQREAIVFDAIKDFDPSKGKFVTWMGNKVRYHCLNTFKSKTKYFPVDPKVMEQVIDSRQIFNKENHEHKELEIEYINAVLDQMQDERIRKIIDARYYSENKKHTKFAHIAKTLGMSTQGVIDLHDKFINFIRRKIVATENMDRI